MYKLNYTYIISVQKNETESLIIMRVPSFTEVRLRAQDHRAGKGRARISIQIALTSWLKLFLLYHIFLSVHFSRVRTYSLKWKRNTFGTKLTVNV